MRPRLSRLCHVPSRFENVRMVVPGTCTIPSGSSVRNRMDRAIFERAKPSTSFAWQSAQSSTSSVAETYASFTQTLCAVTCPGLMVEAPARQNNPVSVPTTRARFLVIIKKTPVTGEFQRARSTSISDALRCGIQACMVGRIRLV
jgi:hypothetical protein